MIILYAIVGLLVGGMLNLLADVMPHRARLRRPYCTHCDVPRRPVAWLAATAYILDRGRCPDCGAHIRLRGLLVELGTAAVFAFLYAHYGLSGYLLLVSAYMAILILVTVTDLEHRLILNRVIGPAILLALIASPFTPDITWKQALVGGVIGFVFFYVVALVYPGGMGAGDVKLAAFIGLITGFPVVVLAILVTILAGGVISLFLVVTRLRSMRDAIPYGPFLVIGGAFSLIWGQPVVDDYLEQYRDARVIETMFVQDERPGLYAKDRLWLWSPQSNRSSSSQSSGSSSSI